MNTPASSVKGRRRRSLVLHDVGPWWQSPRMTGKERRRIRVFFRRLEDRSPRAAEAFRKNRWLWNFTRSLLIKIGADPVPGEVLLLVADVAKETLGPAWELIDAEAEKA